MAFVKSIREGGDIDDISEKNGVPARNLFRWVGEDTKWHEEGNEGPLHLQQTVKGAPVGRKDIVRKASHIFKDGYSSTSSYRVSKSVSKVRNYVTKMEVATFFGSLAKVIVEENMDATRVFNVDETAFESSRKTTRVRAVAMEALSYLLYLFYLVNQWKMKFLNNVVYLELQLQLQQGVYDSDSIC
ncbi:hypothetical protein L916_00609 [Phytophthora nicotianae]|uniref:Uncharacterized protein n=1 Tax=Phytophthora nicotianae TaxID=4792 RepID=W2JWW3_PHYNI|nr:hypothetical protein L916_00609 [Phytophthora nicotianae]